MIVFPSCSFHLLVAKQEDIPVGISARACLLEIRNIWSSSHAKPALLALADEPMLGIADVSAPVFLDSDEDGTAPSLPMGDRPAPKRARAKATAAPESPVPIACCFGWLQL